MFALEQRKLAIITSQVSVKWASTVQIQDIILTLHSYACMCSFEQEILCKIRQGWELKFWSTCHLGE